MTIWLRTINRRLISKAWATKIEFGIVIRYLIPVREWFLEVLRNRGR